VIRADFLAGANLDSGQPDVLTVLDGTVFPVPARRTAAGISRADHGESVMNRIPAKRPRLRLAPELYENLRQQVLRRDGWRCQSCGALSHLEVHHRELRSHSGDDTEQNLITLCTACHSIVHRGRDFREIAMSRTPILKESFSSPLHIAEIVFSTGRGIWG
jgi:hypothetical protein